jgi:hypothetical protein
VFARQAEAGITWTVVGAAHMTPAQHRDFIAQFGATYIRRP